MLLKLREDARGQAGDAFSVNRLQQTLLRNGLATFSVHRQLMLKDSGGSIIE